MAETSTMLEEFMTRLIEGGGGAVEPAGPAALEYVVPEPLGEALGLPDAGLLAFGPDAPAGARRVALDAELLERAGRAIGPRGRLLRMAVHPGVPEVGGPERVLEHRMALQNAVYRFAGTRVVWTRYLVVAFRYAARSEETRDGLMRVAINLSNGSAIDAGADALAAAALGLPAVPADAAPPEERLPDVWEARRLRAFLERGVRARAAALLAPFLAALGRRQERDLARLGDYYGSLRREAAARARKAGADPERERARAEAVAREYGAKIADLARKYATTVEVECLQTLDLRLPVRRFDMVIKRRKGERPFHLDWNPVLRDLEPLPCEYTFASDRARLVCDDALHLVSPAAHGPCAGCGKSVCRACHTVSCPKCGGRWPDAV